MFLEMLLSVIRACCCKRGQGTAILIPSGPTHPFSPAPSAPPLPRPLLICRGSEEAAPADLGTGEWMQEVSSLKCEETSGEDATFGLLFGFFCLFGDLNC